MALVCFPRAFRKMETDLFGDVFFLIYSFHPCAVFVGFFANPIAAIMLYYGSMIVNTLGIK